MSLFQCEQCGCCENTALSSQGIGTLLDDCFDWHGMEDRKGKRICSACAPKKLSDGTASELGKWHGKFEWVFLPMGMFKTNKIGNLEHKETGSEKYKNYSIEKQ